ncbi:MAG: DNA polymerase beta superfamily protein [Anaerobacillus sp.]|uniref:DNA polymerase beta superfamily protein n=1 Tax=Anaerobacillus sp. TaxID=1872506 RepID=UPI00391BF19A
MLLLKKSNPTLLECLHSTNVYEQNIKIISIIKEAVPSLFSQKACFYHYLKMATSNYQIVLKGNTSVKQYLNVIRPLLMCLSLEKEFAFPPLELQRLVHLCDPYIKEQIKELILLKKGQNGTPNYTSLNTFIETEINRLAAVVNQLSEGKENDSRRLDEIFTFALKTVWNINF